MKEGRAENKMKPISVRVEDKIYKAIAKAAKDDGGRSIASWVRKVLSEAVKK